VPRRPSNHVDDPVAVGARIRTAREAAGLTQRELAFDGCTAAYLSRIEVGQRIPSYQILRVLAGRLGTTADFLATGVEPGIESVDPLFEAELAVGTGDVDQGRALYEVAARGDDVIVAARAEAGLGRLAFNAGAHETAAVHLEAALGSGQLPPADRRQAQDVLGRALALLARFEESLAVLEAGLADARAEGDEVAATRFTVLLANLLIDRGSYERAELLLAGILDAARAASDPVALSNLYWSQARLHASQQHPDLAARYARLAHATLESTEHTVMAARALLLVAHMENDRGNHAEALERVDEGAAVLAAAGNRYDEGMLLLEKARALAALGQPDEAASIALGAVPRFEHAQPAQKARSYAIAAGVLKNVGDNGRALELYELAAEGIPSPDRLSIEVYRAIAEIHEAEGRPDEAMAALKRALAAQDPARRPA
jgi:transcriptional regulator with XRE-family HTH domain